jgi:lipopolysaccharide/colanic/teichoic acid biosynthesis glycosyltransferase/NDP-sugar pyrophosphorylase family protein
MNAILLAGGQDTHLVPLVHRAPKALLPVVNRPMVEHLLLHLKKNGIRNVALAVNGHGEAYRKLLGDGSELGMRITYSHESAPRGTAGCLLPLADFIGNDPFLVIHGSLFLDANLRDLVESHVRSAAAATVGVHATPRGARDWHRVELEVGEGSRVNGIKTRDQSPESQPTRVPVGVYVFDPSVLSAIEPGIYYDIKEQLLPRLRAEGHLIVAKGIGGYCKNILELKDYLSVNRDVLNGIANSFRLEQQVADGIWVGRGSQVSPMATLLGPVLIGRDCVIGPRVQIVGPACIGDGCVVEEGTLIRESLLLPGARMERNSRAEGCVLAADTVISPGLSLRGVVAIPGSLGVGDIDLADTDPIIRGVVSSTGQYARSRFRYGLCRLVKRSLDLIVSAVGLVAALPLLLVVGLAVKLTTPGPVFFRQRRCGKFGKEFSMVKFRTMVRDAEAMQTRLRQQNEVDGPIFKIEKDPRFTRLGKLLRRYSIDELPQLWNVLMGEMSLVGPRPLAANEMAFCPAWRDVRLKVCPGITGLWQVGGRSKTSFHDWIRLDTKYVLERSTFLDFKILMKTLLVVLNGRGSY